MKLPRPTLQMLTLPIVALFLAGCRPAPEESDGVQLVQSATPPVADMTFELRFERFMAAPRQIGAAGEESPLIFSPPLKGKFTWLSARSGTFTPEEPLALDRRYELSLRPRLRQADGEPARVSLHHVLKTPPFELTAFFPESASTNATSEPEIKLVFNDKVRASDAAAFLVFRDQQGACIPADVRQGQVEDLPTWAWNNQLWPWNYTAHPDADQDPTNEVPNLLIVTPHAPLSIGRGWELAVRPGLPAADPRLSLRGGTRVAIGDVTPFRFVEAEPQNIINSEPRINLFFSKMVSDCLTNGLNRWMEITPCPRKLRAEVEGRCLILRGAFQSHTEYRLQFRKGLPSAEAFALGGMDGCVVAMPPIASRLYFPAFAEDQLAAGNRAFPLLAVNVPRVRLRAKVMDPGTAIHALRGYRSYFASVYERENWERNGFGYGRGFWEEEPFRQIDYNLVPGRTVFQTDIPGALEPDTAHRIELSWDQILGGRKNAVVFLEAQRGTETGDQSPTLGTQALMQLTDLGMIWKRFRTGLQVFVFSERTAQPVVGAKVHLVSEENEILLEAETDTNGLASLHGQIGETNAQWVTAEWGGDFHALDLHQHQLGLWAYQVPYKEPRDSAESDGLQVMLFGDRGLYRPGEMLHLKAIAREWGEAGLALPRLKQGKFEIEDARGNQFFQTNLVFNELGSGSLDLPLPMTPRGQYTAKISIKDQEFPYGFQVQDFQPGAFEVFLRCKPAFMASERIALPVSARYYFGKPLSKARVKWSLRAEDTFFQPEGFDGFTFQRSDGEFRMGRGSSSLAFSGQEVLGGSNNLVLSPEVPLNHVAPQPRSVSMLVEVTDLNQQTVSQSAEFVLHSSDFYLGLKPAGEAPAAGKELQIEAVAVGAEGKPWPAPIQARLQLRRVEWESVRLEGAGHAARYRNEPIFTDVTQRELELRPAQLPAKGEKEIKGQALEGLGPLRAGEYFLELSSQDGAGRAVVSSISFNVAAPAPASWDYRNDVQVALHPDRTSYAPGQTAEVLVEAPFSGQALVSVERERVLRSFVVRLEGNAPTIHVPVEAGDIPNVFVNVTLLRGSDDCPRKIKEPEFRSGYCQIEVMNPTTRLNVEVSTGDAAGANLSSAPTGKAAQSVTNFLPGQNVEASVTVKDSSGHPVSGAEVALYAVDDGILSLHGYTLPDPLAFFYAPHALAVQSGVSLLNLMPEDPEQLRFENKGFVGGGGGLENVRKNFLACAFWKSSLRTDEEGRLSAHFAAPDSLTRYRVFAVAQTADSRFGGGQATFQVSKPLQILPSLPQFASLGDHLVARAVIQNQTAQAERILVTLELDDKARRGDANSEPPIPKSGKVAATDGVDRARTLQARPVLIAANGSGVVEFPLEFVQPGLATWTWRASFAEAANCDFVDAVQSTMPVNTLAPLLREVLLARMSDGQTNLLASANPQLLAGTGIVSVAVANTRLCELVEAAAQLLHYPYGCAEQTGSSLLPWLVLRSRPELLAFIRQGQLDFERPIRAGIDRFFSLQTESGGLGYWPGSKEPMLWASAYGGLILALAQRQGFSAPTHDYERLMKYLSEQLRDIGEDEHLSDCCLALYALAVAGRAEPAYDERLFELRERLSTENRALLALALAEAHGPGAMIGELLRAKPGAARGEEFRFGCASRESAICLLAWCAYQPEDPRVDRLVEDLIHGQKRGHWDNTQADAWALLALGDYAARVEGPLQPTEGRLRWHNQTFAFKLGTGTNLFTRRFVCRGAGDESLLLINDSTNRLYSTAILEILPPVARQPRQDLGFSLLRSYERLDDDNQLRGLEGLRVGDRVLVTLRFGLREPARFVAIDDALPSVLEAINPGLATTQAREPSRSFSAFSGEEDWWEADFKEIRKDRMLTFVNELRPGHYALRYLTRVRAAGAVTAPCAKIEEMYEPGRYGLSEAQAIMSEGWE